MEYLKNDSLLTLNEDTIQTLRKEYDLDKPGRMDQAIDVLVEWLKKQEHFLMKEFPRDYLERKIIFCKGSLERVKIQLDRTCVFRTIMPLFYENINFKTDYEERDILYNSEIQTVKENIVRKPAHEIEFILRIDALLPKLTEDHYRIYFLKNNGKKVAKSHLNYFRFTFSLIEYILAHDYCKGLMIIFDVTDGNIYEIAKSLDISQLRQAFKLLIEAYGMRIKSIHIVYPSRTIETLIALFKQVITVKIAERIQVHKDMESLCKFVTKALLPNEAGGSVGSINELHENWIDAISSEEFQEVYNEMKEAKTNEEYRQLDKFKNEYLGMPGTFRSLNVD